MKLPFTIYDSRFTIWKKSSNLAVAGSRARAAGNHQSQAGIALVITLILLSVTLVMALAFLAISNRERSSVTTSTDTVTARLAADAALAQAQGQIIASIYATANPYNYGLLVSTNYINTNGFVANISDPTNVNYFYGNGNPLNSTLDFEQNSANLLFLPRAPVFVPTNSIGSNEFRFYLDLNRDGHFEDTRDDVPNVDNQGFTNGFSAQVGDPQWVGILERPDVPHGPNNHFSSRYAFIAMAADNALDLNAVHNQSLDAVFPSVVNPPPAGDNFFRNQGVGSWEINLAAFLADLNTNQWGQIVGSGSSAPAGSATYYQYNQLGIANSGRAFEDASALLAYRYNNNYASLPLASAIFPTTLLPGPVDIFPFGSAMTNTAVPFYNYALNKPWAGADNTNHYFDVSSDLFDDSKTAMGVAPGQITSGNYFTGRLLNAATNTYTGNTVATYDRYTFYRMLAQLGTDSSPEQNKINLNYSNAVAYTDGFGVVTNIVVFPNAETNLVPWQPLQFFTIAADRMLREYTANWFRASPSNYLATYYNIHTNYYYTDGSGNIHTNDPSGAGLTSILGVPNVLGLISDRVPAFGITNIPVQVNGQFVYSPAVQRVLQLAANIYDATTNQTARLGKNYPSVFRPVFFKEVSGSVTNVTIVGFQDVSLFGLLNEGNTPFGIPPLDLPVDASQLVSGYTPVNPLQYIQQLGCNVYGVPWIIGAKKGFPNFNEFSMESVVQVTRKLQLSRTNATSTSSIGGVPMKLTGTNQMYIFGITNYLGVECWNSYSNAFNNVQIVVRDNFVMSLTNGAGVLQTNYFIYANTNVGQLNGFIWPGWSNNIPNPGGSSSFVLPLGTRGTNLILLPSSVYRFGSPSFVDVNLNPPFESYSPTMLPQFGLQVTNQLQVFMLDNGHVIDYVQFKGPNSQRILNNELSDPDSSVIPAYLWSTNLFGTVPWGVINQINVSSGAAALVTPQDGGGWNYPPGLPPSLHSGGINAIVAYFGGFLAPNSIYSFGGKNYTNTEYVVQAPYTPTRTIVDYVSWQANDPLVHYLANDLNYVGAEPSTALTTGITSSEWSSTAPPILPGLGAVNDRYQPWGKVHTYSGADNNGTNTAYRDPLVRFSDNWGFPTDKLPTVGWLGRVHRGTPWQTVYLKASNILKGPNGIGSWTNWTGNANLFNATNTAPLQDRALFDIFSTALNDNATRGQMSVNLGANGRPSLAAWSALFSGITVPTSLTNSYKIINPAGVNQAGSLMYQIVTNINYTRSTFTNADGVVGSFERAGDILSVAALSEKSPFLTGLNFSNGVSDALEEWLPQQTMSLLRASSAPRYVIYSYGQTLKPAPDGVVTGGPSLANGASAFGMVTNYQVVAETATRAVVQVNPVLTTNLNGTLNTNYSLKIEQFNVLPPN